MCRNLLKQFKSLYSFFFSCLKQHGLKPISRMLYMTRVHWSTLRGLALKLNTLCWGFLIIYQRLLRYNFQFPFAILAPWLDVQGDPTLFSAPCSNWIYMCVMTWREIIQRMSYSSSQEEQCMNRFLSGWRTLNGNEIYFILYFINPGGEIRLCHPI